MITSPDTAEEKLVFDRTVKEITRNYLKLFPEERERQSEFLRHLDNPALDLRLRSTIPEGHLCASGILVLPNNKILMLEHKALGIWVVPGGHYDIEDGPLSVTALRETEEETGLSGVRLHPWHIQHGMPIDIDTHPIPANEKKNEAAHQHFDFRYVLEVENPEQLLEQLSLDTNEVLTFDAISVLDIDPKSSIAPAIAKLHLLR